MRPMRLLIYGLEFLLILVASSALIRYVISRPTSQRDAKAIEFHAANAAKFKSLYSDGMKEIGETRYADALASFREAEQTAGQLSNDEYDDLKNGRQQIASADDAAGRTAEAQDAYRAMFNSATEEGRMRLRAHEYDGALAKFQDAEQSAGHLTDGKEAALLSARGDLVACYRGMQRYEDAVDAGEQMIDSLRQNSDEYDRALTLEYLEVAQSYSLANNWESAEPNLQIAISLSEKRIGRYSGDTQKSQDFNLAVGDKDSALYGLVLAYNHEGKTDYALGSAEDLYSWNPNSSAPWSDLWPYQRKAVAKLALQVATQANRKDAMDLWSKRLNPAPNPAPAPPRAYAVRRPAR